mmetsp:Transcript_13665/g.32780  ORF Transcript_13665/g.32780 Transcript_13665/m.32780 type:complete len:177 (-) Transcript_13665:271-801(-)
MATWGMSTSAVLLPTDGIMTSTSMSDSAMRRRRSGPDGSTDGDTHPPDGRGYDDDDVEEEDDSLTAADHAAKLLERSVHISIVFAIVAYTAIGVCGYGLYGEDTADNILLNLRSPPLDALMTMYACLCFPPMFHALRYTMDTIADGTDAPRPQFPTHFARVSAMLERPLLLPFRGI